ncbi:MAG: hypothetical protein R3E96_09820 [Planctomycetota bacterium]
MNLSVGSCLARGCRGAAGGFDLAGDGTRVYCTGDLVRWSAAGELDFLGRIDEQLSPRFAGLNPRSSSESCWSTKGVLER